MVHTSKTAIKCPSANCDFAYFASSPDPAGKLRNHFNNLKVRDADHESFFKKPYCVFCGNVILTKTRKGLWKTGMNKHWLLDHSGEFAEAEDHQGNGQEMRIAVILSTSQLERLSNEWQLRYDLEEGDLIIRTGKATYLERNMVIANNVSQKDAVPARKRQRIAYDQTQTGPDSTCQQSATDVSLHGEQSHQSLGVESNDGSSQANGEMRHGSAGLPFGTSENPLQIAVSSPLMESYSADAFEAMTYRFADFEDDTLGDFE